MLTTSHTVSQSAIEGCILGTALGDAAGLKREGLSRDRAIWLHGSKPSPDLIFGRGFCSDDTEHTVLIGCAMLESQGEPQRFERLMARSLRRWLITCPPGIGFGTLRAITKSFFVSARKSGVNSAGNGPAMRSAILGVLANDESQLEDLVQRSTRITHADPRAGEGALLVAKAARFASRRNGTDITNFIHQLAKTIEDDDLRGHFEAIEPGLRDGLTPFEFAEQRGWSKGVSGFINHTVPAAIYCWAHSPKDFRAAVTNAILLGGDTDSVAAITGAICGAGVGTEELPSDWLKQLAEWPRTKKWMTDLATRLHTDCQQQTVPTKAPSLHWFSTLARNLIFGVVVICLYFRRFIPIGCRQ